MSQLGNITNVGFGLDNWSNWARDIRIATRQGMPHPPFIPGGTIPIDQSAATKYYTGAAALIAILFLSFFFILVGSLIQCCCVCCCMKSVRKRRKSNANQSSKVCSGIWLVIIYVAFLIGAITSFLGGNLLANNIWYIRDGTVGTLEAAKGIVLNIRPSIVTTFDNLGYIVNVAINSTISAVDFDALYSLGVISNMNTLADGMDYTQGNVTQLLGDGENIKNSRAAASANINALAVVIGYIDGNISSWSNSGAPLTVPSPGTGTYYKTSAINTNGIATLASDAQSNIANSPDGASQLNPLRSMPNLNTFATEIRGIVNLLNVDVRGQVASAGDDVRASVGPALNTAKLSIVDGILPVENSAVDEVDPILEKIEDNFQLVSTYENQRSYAMISLSSIVILILFLWSVAMVLKKPGGAKACNLVSTPFYLLILILGIIMFILALVVGDVCASVFESYPPPISSALPNDTGTFINQVFEAKNSCVANKSLITIAVDLGFINASTVNVSGLASSQIDGLDFSGIANGFDLSNAVDLSSSPTSQLNTLNTLDLSGLSTTALGTLRTTTLPDLKNQLNNLRSALDALSAASELSLSSQFTYIPSSPSGATVTAAVTDFKARLAVVSSLIDGLTTNGGTVDDISTSILSLEQNIDTLKNTATSLKTIGQAIPGYYDNAIAAVTTFANQAQGNLTNIIPEVKTNIKNAIAIEETRLLMSLNCTDLGTQMNVLQDAICVKVLAGFDSLWLSYGIIGFFAAVSMPALIYAMNRLFSWKWKVDPEYEKVTGTYNRVDNIRQTFPETEELITHSRQGSRSVNITIH